MFPQHTSKKLQDLEEYLESADYVNKSVARLTGAVQIPTQSFDDMGPIGEDKRWDIFYELEAYLEKTYPLVHSTFQKDVVNTHGLIFTWEGTDSSLKPTLLMAHQDVVPVPDSTVDAWTYPPFGGDFDGKYVWGRGSFDCKDQLTAILDAMEGLVDADFQPKRTIVLSFGFDEEISGRAGAGHLAPYLLNKYGKDSMAAIVDEGAPITEAWGSTFATPGVAEKGYVDVEIIVRMPGGHSSIPPQHNGIGVMSELISLLEAHPNEPRLYDSNPYLAFLQCGAEHSPDFPSKLRKLLSKRTSSTMTTSTGPRSCKAPDKLAHEASKLSPYIKYLMTTSQAVDLISGGAKVNALPERTTATVNHRINVGETPSLAKSKLAHLAATIAHKYHLTLHAYPPSNTSETENSITLHASATELEPSPVTLTDLDDSPYAVLSGTTRALYGSGVVMAPGIMTGNTDTRYYWDLSRHVFRYAPGWDEEDEEGGLGSIHTVNERRSVRAHVKGTRFWVGLVRNLDERSVE
ncbi:MAG: hypothetical protein Q9227_009328 [Pyrenula ochraceoflavens]